MSEGDRIPPHLVSFFSRDILGVYESQPDKFAIEDDYFHGKLKTLSFHPEETTENSEGDIINVRFGYRTRVGGDLALAVWMPDLRNASINQSSKWRGFVVARDSLTKGPDARFEMWVRRFYEGSWGVNNGVLARIKVQVRELNELTTAKCGYPLFKYEDLSGIRFPRAQNDYSYHDAHFGAYKLLIDGLNKDAIVAIADRLDIPLKDVANLRKLTVLGKVLPVRLHPLVFPPLNLISTNRGLSAHSTRPPAKPMDAFEEFNADMTAVETGINALKTYLGPLL